MTLRHIKIFLAVCDNGNNTTKAAQALYMAQPAVSVAVSELEKYYGVKFFDRISRRLMLTEAGERFREYAVHIASLFDDVEKGMRDWDAFGVLRVGASITIGSQFLPGYVESFQARCPGTDVRVVVGPSDLLEEKLMSNALDLALVEGPVHGRNLVSEEYMEDELTVVCATAHPLAQRGLLPVEEFKRQRFLLREKGSGTREEFDAAAAALGFTPEPAWEATSTTALVSAAIHGLGVTVLPRRMVAGPLERGHVAELKVEGLELRRRFRLVYHRDKYLTRSARSFLDLCRSYELDYPLPGYSGLY